MPSCALPVRLALAAAALLGLSLQTRADDTYPSRPVHLVSGFAAGGGADVLGRIIARRLSEVLRQQVVVENVTGAGGMVGAARVVKSPPDGYQVLLGSRADAINMTLYKKPLYDFRADLMPVVLIAVQPMILLTRLDYPAANLQEFIAYTKKNQDTVKFGSAGAGSTGHLDCVLLNAGIGVNVTHVPYRGGGAAIQDLVGGVFDYMCTLVPTAVPMIEGKLVKPIAVFTSERAANLPDVPTAPEQGFGSLEALTWFALFVPTGTPEPVIRRLHDATVLAMDTPSVQEQLLKAGATIVSPERRSSAFLKTFVESEIERNAKSIRASGVSIE
jgi:tripartite-type tricarboxylate transporter receptor subunit TctC